MSYAVKKDGTGCRAVNSEEDCADGEYFSADPLIFKQLGSGYADLRAAAYRSESDPLFFKSQRGECAREDWEQKIVEIKARFPKE